MKKANDIPLAEIVSASVRGASHIRDKKCCQDAISIKEGTFRGQPYLVCSVADGHGSPAYPHSDAGSMMAALAAEQSAVQFILGGKVHRGNRGALYAKHVCQCLKDEWEENIKQARQMFRISHDIARKHGTTILSVLIYRGHVYMAQLGDGEICYMDRKGNPVFLVPPETGPVSSITASLCSTDANECWKFACIPAKDIGFLMMSTDGLMNSLVDNDEYVKLATTLKDYLNRFRPAQINKVLSGWLSDYSEEGSCDDISLVAIKMEPNKNKHGRRK